ncbi:hypothetical protein [Roseovarius sp. SYSU LYC5161]|uniref:hypothetical protein n=1 Tax=Roseovarius halophilus (ex Wu et al. 2025) TaxID=3376060 RepID=UPI00399BD42C
MSMQASGDAKRDDEPDAWLLQVRLDRLEHDLSRARNKADYWKAAAQDAAEKLATLEERLAERDAQAAEAAAREDPRIRQLTLQVSHRDAAIDQLREDQETQKEAFEDKLATLEKARAEEAKELENRLETMEAEKQALGDELESTRDEAKNHAENAQQKAAELDRVQAALEDRYGDIAALGEALETERERRQDETASLGRLLEAARQKLAETETALQHAHHRQHVLDSLGATKAFLNAALGRPLAFRRHQRARNRINEDMRLIAASGLFDAEWYLQRYPDLAQAKDTPLRHFVRYGAYELRDPGPEFDSMKYHLHNPDVTAHGMAALMHYVRSGKSEGRDAFKVADPEQP